MNIPGLGLVTKDSTLDWYYSEPISIPVLGNQACQVVLEGYDDDPNPEDFHVAIRNFLTITSSVLQEVEEYIYQYYRDCNDGLPPEDEAYVAISAPSEVWSHIRLGKKPLFTRRGYGEQGIYVSLDCGCDWEEEHGLQIVFKNGLKVNKVGAYDGHVTNSDAYGDENFEAVIYK